MNPDPILNAITHPVIHKHPAICAEMALRGAPDSSSSALGTNPSRLFLIF
ncbi:MAG: hypothetical protein ACW990_07715 [Promethearchaeota archaeon]